MVEIRDRLRRRTYAFLETELPASKLQKAFNTSLICLIILNIVAVVIETIEPIEQRYGSWLYVFDLLSVAVFSVEYLLRLWCRGPGLKRMLAYAVSPMGIADLLAILPSYIPRQGLDLRVLRAIRLMRLLRILKVAKFTASLQAIGEVVKAKRDDLAVALSFGLLLLLFSASLMYHVEHDAQPDVFSSIPATLWWSVSTLTTVGYGDAYPITTLGKVLGSVIAILGIGMFALPTAILGAGFVEALEARHKGGNVCPHCGREI